ncbi:FMN-dependent NADH-azoreductase [Tenacibaculum sp. MAR_2009_124]|uniref:NAD(P)H-dependent oxidoreductase n=1 Tax=Tenacibaculum sp. MAR_2009_124 TaxID=1250059 RepID=UPI000894AF73|nr:NAD(P)H-dependent oxidoreductase [Tenacibaculum sp. MAR_2009_124]SED06255.1 FMN-dependent NADH-azoreductase [Tenacibaculum sp. MAR_2009_124]
MTETLIVSYAPRIGSYNKVLVNEFISLANSKTKIKHLDLVESPPDLLLKENLNLMMDWNQGKRAFSNEERLVLLNHHALIEEFLLADYIVLAFPIYNFTMPATVKAWIDAIVVSDRTFSFTPEKGFKGTCENKRALSVVVAGFDYNNSNHFKEYASCTVKQNFDFMGVRSKQVSVFGVDQNKEHLDSILDQAKAELKATVSDWFES